MTLEELVVQNAGWIRKMARRYYCDEWDADDLAGETICKCLRQSGRFDPGRSFRPWALAIMENTFITQYNRRRCVMFTALDGSDPASCYSSPDQLVSVRQMFSLIRGCARQSRCIRCVVLYAKGFSYSEIAAIEGIPVGTVKSRVAAGRRMLREALE